jgi:hypothetical protein
MTNNERSDSFFHQIGNAESWQHSRAALNSVNRTFKDLDTSHCDGVANVDLRFNR